MDILLPLNPCLIFILHKGTVSMGGVCIWFKGGSRMNIENLREGMTIKNYKELCELLGIEEKKGNSQAAQYKEMRRYFKYEKRKQSFFICEIYNSPMVKKDDREKGNNSVYLSSFEFILLNYLANRRTSNGRFETVELTTNQLLKVTAMVNSNYAEKDFNEYILGNHSEINQEDIDDFYRVARPRFHTNIKKMMENLKKRFILTVEKKYKIKIKGEWVTADEEEVEMIYKINRQVLDEMGFVEKNKDDLKEVYAHNRQFEFFKRVDKEIVKQYGKIGWGKIFQVYSFGFSNTLDRNIERYKREIELINQERKYLNSRVKDRFNESLDRRYDKDLNNVQLDHDKILDAIFMGSDDEEDIATDFVFSNDYIIKQKKLVNLLIERKEIL